MYWLSHLILTLACLPVWCHHWPVCVMSIICLRPLFICLPWLALSCYKMSPANQVSVFTPLRLLFYNIKWQAANLYLLMLIGMLSNQWTPTHSCIGKWRQNDYPFVDNIRAIYLTLEKLIEAEQTQVNGLVILVDYSGVGLSQASNPGPFLAKKVVGILQVRLLFSSSVHMLQIKDTYHLHTALHPWKLNTTAMSCLKHTCWMW